jgi:adenylyltransferase/sulfurtransferase
METVKLLLGVGETLAGRLLIFDALDMTWREVRLRRNLDCPVCGDHPTQTGLIDYEVFCGVKTGPADDPGPPVPEVDALEAARRLGTEEPPFLLDVREPWEWSISNLEDRGAHLIPLAELPRRLGEVPAGRPVVVYCRSGQRSLTAARQLLEDGRTDVYNLRGGILAWARDVEPDLVVV